MEEQAQLRKSFALEKLELTYRKCGKPCLEAEMLWALLKDGPAVSGGEQEYTDGPMIFSASRREHPCHVDPRQSPCPGTQNALKESQAQKAQLGCARPRERGFCYHRGVVPEDIMPSANGPASLSQPEAGSLLLGTEGDALSTESQRVGWGETKRQQS